MQKETYAEAMVRYSAAAFDLAQKIKTMADAKQLGTICQTMDELGKNAFQLFEIYLQYAERMKNARAQTRPNYDLN